MITVFIKELKFKAIIGLLDFERVDEQEVVMSANMSSFNGEFIDYAIACEIIKKTVQNGRFETVEEALSECAKNLKSSFSFLKSLRLEISKPNILPNTVVGAKIELEF
ncbi:dihydroneopterin aldolase [Campylobacter sp. 19-13652]|uniref:dihydroneopterin aldolase n=1 Tax=Campylobacter sp. 19-13652 TaxID=2840180 RepID=UPI001C77BE79|nr:dihydroneopterin aldolase [Campylobacter sp. 19-13652]BCX78960.1 dihydroneopterin aldolase [Campylobacter sp. 19-13652]